LTDAFNLNETSIPVDINYPTDTQVDPEFDKVWYDRGYERGFAHATEYIHNEWEATLARCRGNKSVAIGQFLPWFTNLVNEMRNVQ
jgi:hypothetical protein